MSSIVVTSMILTDHLMTSREFKTSVSTFLGQFATIGSRWGGMFEMMTEKVLQEAANFQYSWLQRSNLCPIDRLDESTLIAASLCCLTLANEIYQVTINWRVSYRLKYGRWGRLTELERDPIRGISPAVEICRFPCKFKCPPYKRTFGSTLRIILQKLQTILYRRRPEDEPYIFYTLCILALFSNIIGYQNQWTAAFRKADRELRDGVLELCEMYHLSTNNRHPLNSNFDIDEYAALVDGNELVTKHLKTMHDLWMINGSSTLGLILV